MERRLLTVLLSPDFVPKAPGEGGVFNLGSPFDAYGEEWRVVSHAINLMPNGAFLTVLVERPPLASTD